MVPTCTTQYRARNPRATPLYRLFDLHFYEVKGQWEECFERRFGFWRGFVDEQVLRYLDCGLYENGFARIRCPECAEEYLLAFSCKTRELCPSCAAKRGRERCERRGRFGDRELFTEDSGAEAPGPEARAVRSRE